MTNVIGIDVGGTFTDFVMSDRESGQVVFHKEPSTPEDPARAVELGLASLLDREGSTADAVAIVAHGTTLALNAILQRRGARLALIVSRGNRDVLEIARLRMDDPYSFPARPERPLVDREFVFEVDTRLDSRGSLVESASAEALDALCRRIADSRVDAVAVMLMNSYAAPGVESALAAKIAEKLPGLAVTSSAELWPEIREYERASVAILNAYIAPLMNAYYGRLEGIFSAAGLSAPLLITASNGGTIDIATARQRPIDSILSGPASGVVAAIGSASSAGVKNLVTFDMGGTSADIAVVEGDQPEIVGNTQIGEIPLMLPVVNVGAIGAGGGSVIHVDRYGILKVGPRSAGANPGPACYGRDGAEPTITDCYLACNYVDPDKFLGGRLKLDKDAALAALAPIAGALALASPADAAAAALKLATSMMATEVRKMLARRGAEPGSFTLVPFGGAGPTHAAMIADAAGIGKILVPRGPSTFCAFGAIIADLRRDFVRSVDFVLDGAGAGAEELAGHVDGLIADGRPWREAVTGYNARPRYDLSFDIRYPGQAFDITVSFERYAGQSDLAEAIAQAFHATHERLYGFKEAHSPVQVRRVSLSIRGEIENNRVREKERNAIERPSRKRILIPDAGWIDADIRSRDNLCIGERFAGPVVIEEPDTTVVLTGGWEARLLPDGNILATRG